MKNKHVSKQISQKLLVPSLSNSQKRRFLESKEEVLRILLTKHPEIENTDFVESARDLFLRSQQNLPLLHQT
jgi:hypothetical protein